MNPSERGTAAAEGQGNAGTQPEAAQRLALLHAAVLQQVIAGRLLEALSLCQQALALDPANADSLHLMGVVHLEGRQFDHAAEWAARAIQREPKPAYLATLGFAFSYLGRHGDALKVFDAAVRLAPGDPQLWWQRGSVLMTADRLPEALASFGETLKLDPRHADAAYKSAHILHGLGRTGEALAHLDRSAELQPQHAQTRHTRALVLKELGRLDEALAESRRAVELDPANPDTIGNLGAVLNVQGRTEEALSAYERALQLRPDHVRMIVNRASALAELGRREEAIAECRRALAIDPDFAEAAWNLSLMQLQQGDFERGWKGREVRWKFPQAVRPSYPKLSVPIWLGEEPLAGKTVLVIADEGFGDSIQFARYLPMLAARGARVILVVEPALGPLLSKVAGVSQYLPKLPGAMLPSADFHCPITCLPLAFGTRLDSIPSARDYLPRPDAALVQAFEERLGPHGKLRVGLAWSGNPRHTNDRNRSMPLAALSRLLEVDATFISVQKDPRPRDDEMLRARPEIIDLTAELSDFATTAALVSCLDLLISVDTSVAHLGGALGKPVWLLLPQKSDFRWLLGRADSPWYPMHRLFVQDASRNYDGVVDRVHAELAGLTRAFAARQGLTTSSLRGA